jgi:hypothetical protein
VLEAVNTEIIKQAVEQELTIASQIKTYTDWVQDNSSSVHELGLDVLNKFDTLKKITKPKAGKTVAAYDALEKSIERFLEFIGQEQTVAMVLSEANLTPLSDGIISAAIAQEMAVVEGHPEPTTEAIPDVQTVLAAVEVL